MRGYNKSLDVRPLIIAVHGSHHACSETHSGGYNKHKITFVISIESGIAIIPIDITYMTLNSQMTNFIFRQN